MSGPLPPADLDGRQPLIVELPAGTPLHRFYRLAHEPIYFDPSTSGRFNAPDGSYGILYAAKGVEGAFAETFLRVPGRTLLAADFVEACSYVRLRNTRALRLVNLGGAGLARIGATAEILHSGLPYDVPQAWSRALHAHPINADGIAYRGRHDDNEVCCAIFSDASAAIVEIDRTESINEDWFWQIAEPYGVGLIAT